MALAFLLDDTKTGANICKQPSHYLMLVRLSKDEMTC